MKKIEEDRYRTSVVWRRDRMDETRVTFGIGYTGLHRLERLDFLRDLMAACEETYQAELALINNSYQKPVLVKKQ